MLQFLRQCVCRAMDEDRDHHGVGRVQASNGPGMSHSGPWQEQHMYWCPRSSDWSHPAPGSSPTPCASNTSCQTTATTTSTSCMRRSLSAPPTPLSTRRTLTSGTGRQRRRSKVTGKIALCTRTAGTSDRTVLILTLLAKFSTILWRM